MSGMFGFISRELKPDSECMDKTLSVMHHRGPDGSDIVSGDWGMLGANILTPNPTPKQTIASARSARRRTALVALAVRFIFFIAFEIEAV